MLLITVEIAESSKFVSVIQYYIIINKKIINANYSYRGDNYLETRCTPR